MKNTYGLSRVSTTNQLEGTGLEYQNKKIKQYANLHELNLIKVISDCASGGLETRDGIEELKQDVIDGKVDVVLIWNVSRAFRSMVHFSNFYEFLNKHKVELISVSEGIRSSSKTGSLMFGVMVSISQFEKNLIKERMVSGKRTRAHSGVNVGRLPYGYKRINGEVVVDDEEGKAVRYIFKKLNQLKKSKRFSKSKTKQTRHLINLLTENGYTFKGKRFSGKNIKYISTNEWYVGVYKYSDIETKHSYPTLVSKRLFNQVCG